MSIKSSHKTPTCENGNRADGGSSGQCWGMRHRRYPKAHAHNVIHKALDGNAKHVLVEECFAESAAKKDTDIFPFIESRDGMGNIFAQEHCGRWESSYILGTTETDALGGRMIDFQVCI